MRNLKKILALVLALVMSLSLMATASAADTTAAETASKYQTAITVLKELGVVKGDDRGDRPTDPITRAEVAALLYRIDTTDVNDAQNTIHTGQGFTDVNVNDWYAGYVSYCYIAEIIKGNPNGTFEPDNNINGYATLAMILRAMGYGKNGEFVGDGWEIRTASTAKRIGILEGISDTQLSGNAPRELVFEILFRALLEDVVEFDARMPYEYPSTGVTLGYKQFKLEEIEGVVVGNEYADLNSDQVLAEGRTELQVADEEEPRSLAIGTEITDIGESRYAYITGSKVLAMGDTGKNKVTEFGHACDISSDAKFKSVAEMSNDGTEYYINFDPWTSGGYDCDQRLEFSVVFYGNPAESAFDDYKDINISRIAANDSRYSVEVQVVLTKDEDGSQTTVWVPLDRTTITNDDFNTATTGSYTAPVGYSATLPASYGYPVRYTKVIWANRTITDTDLTVLESIFAMADNVQNNVLLTNRITGDVFVGTKSTNSTLTDEERDLSNTISYKKFYDEYINDLTKERNWGESFNGDWVKFVDNNGDGNCEYAFYTWSLLDEAIHTYTNRNGDTVTEFNWFDDNTYDVPDGRYTVRYLDNDGKVTDEVPAVGDKVVAAYIDNQILVEPALNETVTVSEYSWRNDEITTDKGPYGQSGIENRTDMMELISTMDDKVEYIVYFDHFGYVRAYELPGGTHYALVTELYYTNAQQGNYVQDWPMTVELWNGEEGKDEYHVAGGAATFRANEPWLLVNNLASTANYNNWLQPAIAHLGVSRELSNPTLNLGAVKTTNGSTVLGNTYTTFWPANRQLVRNLTGAFNGDEFNYGVQNYGDTTTVRNLGVPDAGWTESQANGTTSFTNVAIVNINGGDATLAGAAKLALNSQAQIRAWNDLDNDGVYDHGTAERPRYSVDYIQLDRTADVVEGAVRYPIGGNSTYVSQNNNYVNAVHDTEFYIVYNGGVYYFKDFVNMPELTNEDNRIHAAYAVARDTSADNAGQPYWVAEVIVYEVYDLEDEAQTSVSLAYYTPTRLSGTVQQVETLNSKYGPMVTLTPGNKSWNAVAGQWGADWDGYGFYGLFNDTEPVDNVMTASRIQRINIGDYAKNKIYAGTVTREAYIAGAGYYIDVDMGGGKIASIEVTDKIYSVTTKSAQSDDWYGYNVAETLRYQNLNNSQVKAGDKVIWVNDKDVKAASVASTATLNATKFVVDLGNTTWYAQNYAGADILTDTPSWLISINRDINGNIIYTNGNPTILSVAGTQTAASNQGEWQRIMYEQGVVPTPDTTDIDFDLALAAGETIQFAYDGADLTAVLPHTTTSVTVQVPGKDLPIVKLTVKTAAAIAAIVPAAGSNWKVASLAAVAGGYEVVVYDSTQVSGRAVNPDDVGTIYTVAKVNALITEASSASDLARIEELTAILTDVKAAVAAAGTGSDIEYSATNSIDGALTTLGTAATSALSAAQSTANGVVSGYESAAVAALTGDAATAATAAATKAGTDITAATTQAEIDAAVAAYKQTINGLLAASNPNLATKRTEALTEVAGYKTTEIAALGQTYKDAIATAKTNAEAKINDAGTEATVTAAVAEYKAAVDAQIAQAATDAAAAEAAAAAKALKDIQDAAKAAVALEIPPVVAEVSEVVDARDALEFAIDNSTATTITNYYADGKLVTNSLLTALQDAVATAMAAAAADAKALTTAKNAAIAAVDAEIAKVAGAADNDAVKAAKTTLVGKINACTSVEGTGTGGAETTSDVEYYYKNTALVAGNEVNALKDAILAVEKENTLAAGAAYLAEETAKLTEENVAKLDVSADKTAFENEVSAATTSAGLTSALTKYKSAIDTAISNL